MAATKTPYVASDRLWGRAEAVLKCPRCGRNGYLKRVGGPKGYSTFRCLASDYPGRCLFKFTTSDRMLDTVKGPR